MGDLLKEDLSYKIFVTKFLFFIKNILRVYVGMFQKIISSHIPILFSGSSLWAKYVAAVKAREVKIITRRSTSIISNDTQSQSEHSIFAVLLIVFIVLLWRR